MEELGGFDAAPQQQGRGSGPDQPSLSPEELLLAVSRIKQERADTPPVGGAVGGAAEDLRCVVTRPSGVRGRFLSSQVKSQPPRLQPARVTLKLQPDVHGRSWVFSGLVLWDRVHSQVQVTDHPGPVHQVQGS